LTQQQQGAIVSAQTENNEGREMSKQSEAKAAQGYIKKPLTCKQCKHRTSEMDWPAWIRDDPKMAQHKTEDRKIESKIRCGLGGFAVGNGAACNKLEPID
jgi:hypothetical protein